MGVSVENLPVQPRVCVVQDGARLHYAVPIALQRAEILELVYTDWYSAPRSLESRLSYLLRRFAPSTAERMGQRYSNELDGHKIHSLPSMMLRRWMGRRKFENDIELFAMLSNRMGQSIISEGFGQANALFGFVRNVSPELCAAARSAGLRVVVDQMIAPFVTEQAECIKQAARFPDWSDDTPSERDEILSAIERRTWDAADHLTCPSKYVATHLSAAGVPLEKISIVPYPFDASTIQPIDRRGRSGPTVAGFIGKVGLRKGAPYLFRVAKIFLPANVRFVAVGQPGLRPDVAERERGHVELVGAFPRNAISGWLEKFDIFCLPSTCEGSAGAIMEAMASGLPVITSPNAGSIVRDGVDGYIVPYDDVEQMQQRMTQLSQDGELRHAMGLSARARVETLNLDRYGQTLKSVYTRLM